MRKLKSIKAFNGAVIFIFDEGRHVQLNSAQPPLISEGEIVEVRDSIRELIDRARASKEIEVCE